VRVFKVGFSQTTHRPVFFLFRCLSSGDGHAKYTSVRVYTVGFARIRVKGLGVRVDPRSCGLS